MAADFPISLILKALLKQITANCKISLMFPKLILKLLNKLPMKVTNYAKKWSLVTLKFINRKYCKLMSYLEPLISKNCIKLSQKSRSICKL